MTSFKSILEQETAKENAGSIHAVGTCLQQQEAWLINARGIREDLHS